MTTLCEVHYKQAHKKCTSTNIRKKCCTCHCTINGKPRHCPNPALINEHFSVGDMSISITEQDYVCPSCYNQHLNLVHAEQLNSQDDELIDLLKTPAPAVETNNDGHAISLALRDVIKQLGDILIHKLGVLLPELYRLFTALALQHADNEFNVLEQFPQVHFLGYIASYFGKHLVWECKQKSCGTLLYRRGADLALALSRALKLLQKTPYSFLKKPKSSQQEAPTGDLDETEDLELTHLLSTLNERMHAQIRTTTSKDAASPFDISSFNLDECIADIDPVLWKMVVVLTRSVTDSCKNTAIDQISHQRKLQCFYTLCVMLFNTNRSCSIPIHVLLTDLVEAQGGTIDLIRTLNRVGAIACADTHQCYAQFFIEKKLELGLLSELDKDAFTVVSVDNIDFLQRHAFVYSGDQKRSWHGTTVQATQPFGSGDTAVTVRNEDFSLPNSLHQEASSTTPSSSPVCPAYKKICRRSRTSTEINSTHYFIPTSPELSSLPPTHPLQSLSHNHYSDLASTKSLKDFQISEAEEKVLSKFKTASFYYMILTGQKLAENLSFTAFLEKIFPHTPTPSKYVYMKVLDQNADSHETIANVVSRLHREFKIGDSLHHLLVAGDAKTYIHLQKVKVDEKLSWLVPFPGDFHVLMNYQPILQKIYFDAGLKQIASACGYRAETLTSLQNSSHFKKTHHFLMQAWDAIFCLMVDVFFSINLTAKEFLKELEQSLTINWLRVFKEYEEKIMKLEEEFSTFLKKKAETDPNWQFWEQFVTKNCFCYVALYCAVRSGNWSLRLGSIKLMAPLFCAFDRTTYRAIIPQHLADCLLLPPSIEDKLQHGGFTVSINGTSWKSVGLDEAHEMLINKDCKMAVVHPNKEFVNRMALYFPFRSKVMHNFQSQIAPPKNSDFLDDLHFSKKDQKMRDNIEVMKVAVSESKTLPLYPAEEPLVLRNAFTFISATPTQQQDLLTFRDVGEKHLYACIEKVYLKKKDKTKLKFHKLKTFSTPKKVTKRNYNQLKKEKDHVTKCLKRRLLSHNSMEKVSDEQYLELPRALADPSGIPHKGSKCSITSYYQSQYEDVITSAFPPNWLPETVILEGMFLINTTPLSIHKSLKEYASSLLEKHSRIYLSAGVKEVHIVFDNPGRFKCHPKQIERERRDSDDKEPHDHCTFHDDAKIPLNWRNVVSCRECKRKLVMYLGDCFLRLAPGLLEGEQKMVIAGVDDDDEIDKDCVWSTKASAIEHSEKNLKCNAEEADTRLWLHVKQSTGRNKLVYSPDTDVYHIGLTCADLDTNTVIVQINPIGRDLKLLNLNHLSEALKEDSDIQGVPVSKRNETFQVLYAATGSDFTSAFVGISKVAFMKVFYEYSRFINSSTPSIPGSLSDVQPESNGFLAFVRLVGVAYFVKNRPAFQSRTPTMYFDSFQNESEGDAELQHHLWYKSIRGKVWERVIYEENLPPTIQALEPHWLRTIWVIDYWRQATANKMDPLPPEWFGWTMENSIIQVEWDSEENLRCIKDRVAFLIHGCGCKTGCKSLRCKCYKAGKPCGPGCNCHQCTNPNKESNSHNETAAVASAQSGQDNNGDPDGQGETAQNEPDNSGTQSEEESDYDEEHNLYEDLLNQLHEPYGDHYDYCNLDEMQIEEINGLLSDEDEDEDSTTEI